MPIVLCQCNGLCAQRLGEVFERLQKETALPGDPRKAAKKVLLHAHRLPLTECFGKTTGSCGGCLPHIEKIVEQKREQAAKPAKVLQTTPS